MLINYPFPLFSSLHHFPTPNCHIFFFSTLFFTILARSVSTLFLHSSSHHTPTSNHHLFFFSTLFLTTLFITQSKQKGEQPPDVARASEEIENVLLRKKVFDLLASTATVTWIDAPAAAAE